MLQDTIGQAMQTAVMHHRAGRLPEAEQLYRRILAEQPEHAGALHYLGVLAALSGRNDIAVDLIRRALACDPNLPEAQCNLGNVLISRGQLDEAIAACRQAIVLAPTYADAHYNLGIALKEKGLLDEAIAAYRRAIAFNPNVPQAHNNLGIALKDTGQLDEAIQAFRHAIMLRPSHVAAHLNLGSALADKRQLDEAITAYRQAISLNPNLREAYNNLGLALAAKGQLDEAIAAYRQAIALNANSPEAQNNLGIALADKGQIDEAIGAYRQAIALRPTNAAAHSNLMFALHLHSAYNAQAIGVELRRWNHQHAEPLRKFIQPHSNDRSPNRRLRIGYVSPDLRDNVVGQNLLPLLQHHDRRQFDISCYTQVVRPDAMTSRLQQHVDGWRNIVGLSDEQVAKQIREDRIDLLVDLTLHTGNNRLLVFARKPAPVQVTWLAYCGSSGMSAMDYRLSDPHLDPPETDLSCYSEKTVRLPQTYWCYRPEGPADEPSPSPGLQKGFITFGCLNNFNKVSSAALDLWARILVAVPNSHIIIHAAPGTHRDQVAGRLERAGVAKDRVSFVARQPWMEYTQTYSQIDIALDPFPYGGGITTCAALWMGVPVVTLSGETAVGRGSRSILSNLGLPELIAFTPDRYVQIAMELAQDRDRMELLRRTMRARMLASPLMDAEGFARDVEAAYRQMWRTWCEN